MTDSGTQLRNAFLALLDGEPSGAAACELAAKLVASTDVLPQEYCDILELAPGSTFGEAARKLGDELACS